MNDRQNINITAFLPLFCAVGGTLVGVVAYFYLYAAHLWPSLAGACCAAVLYLWGRHRWYLAVVLALFVALGVLAASWRTYSLDTTFISPAAADKRYWVAGPAVEVTQKDKTTRLMIEHPRVYGLSPEETPQKIRLSVQASRVKNLQNGDEVVAEVYLQRPNAAKFSGDFDYERYAYYEGFGAVGQVRGDIYFTPPPTAPSGSWRAWREGLSARIYDALGRRQEAAVLVALVTGMRDYVSEDTADNYRNAGLAHLMAISGFNLGAVGLLLYVLVRLAWAAVPGLALRFNGKKPAAVVGLLGALFYTLVAGGNIPVVRAFIMIAALFLAVWVERPRVGLRLLGLAAILVAWAWPEGVLTASYQMSFVASLALILWAYWHDSHYRSRHRVMQGIGYIKAVWVTSLLAGLATMPFVVWHFQNLTLVGFFANLVAVPVMGLLTTPLALAGFLAGVWLPLGVALKPAALTVAWVNTVAETMGHWPLAQNFVPQAFTLPVLLVVLGLLVLVYMRRWLWLTGAGALALGVLLLFTRYDFTPDLVSLDGGKLVLIKQDKAQAFVARGSSTAETKLLLRHYAQYRHWQLLKEKPAASCDLEGCLYFVKDKKVLVPEPGLAASAEDCHLADIIAPDPEVTLPHCTATPPLARGRVVEVWF